MYANIKAVLNLGEDEQNVSILGFTTDVIDETLTVVVIYADDLGFVRYAPMDDDGRPMFKVMPHELR